MKRAFHVFSTLCIIAIALLSQVSLAANDRALFWELKTDKATVYLMGSIHFADDSFYPLRAEIEQAFTAADHLVVEADILHADQLKLQSLLMKEGMYQGEETLRDHISDETYQQLLAYLAKSGLPLPESMLVRQKPGLVAITISSLMLMQHGLNPQLGIDMHFLKQADSSGKSILELEGAEYQLNLLLNFEMAELLLRQSLEQAADVDVAVKQMIAAWKLGDADLVNKLFIEDPIAEEPDFEKLMEQLDFARNREMTKKIQGYIKQGGTYFVVVGAAHLVGDKGIPTLLEKLGHETQRR